MANASSMLTSSPTARSMSCHCFPCRRTPGLVVELFGRDVEPSADQGMPARSGIAAVHCVHTVGDSSRAHPAGVWLHRAPARDTNRLDEPQPSQHDGTWFRNRTDRHHDGTLN